MNTDSYIEPICQCGGFLSGIIGTLHLICLGCKKTFGVVEKDE
jgi:hypothetical protein